MPLATMLALPIPNAYLSRLEAPTKVMGGGDSPNNGIAWVGCL